MGEQICTADLHGGRTEFQMVLGKGKGEHMTDRTQKRVDSLRATGEEGKHPRFRVCECFDDPERRCSANEAGGQNVNDEGDSLFPLERLILHTRLVLSNTSYHFNPFLGCQEPSIGRRIGEVEPEEDRGEEGQDTCDDHEPSPGFETWGMDMERPKGEEAQDDHGSAVHEDWQRASEGNPRTGENGNVHQYPVLCVCSARV